MEENNNPATDTETMNLFSLSLLEREPDQDPTLIARPLRRDDFAKGYCTLLGQLSDIGYVDERMFVQRFDELRRAADVYYIVVVEDISIGRIVGAATLVVEKKFLHSLGLCGHIEDVVVDSGYRGKQLGRRVIQQVVGVASRIGCYKVILDCTDKNVPFYEKCGFTRKELHMARYFTDNKAASL